MIFVPLLGLLVGIVAAMFTPVYVIPAYSVYVAVAILAALDSGLGGVSANFNKTFSMPVFISGFFGNALLAALIVFVGEKLGLDLYLAVVVVFGTRLFQNFAVIRRFILNKYVNSDKV